MAVQRSGSWFSQSRVDTSTMKSVESAVQADFDTLLAAFATNVDPTSGIAIPYILRGFKISSTGVIGNPANTLSMIVANSGVFEGASLTAGTFYLTEVNAPNELLDGNTNSSVVTGAFAASTTNYIGLDFNRALDPNTADVTYFWDVASNSQFSRVVPLARTLNYVITISTLPFTDPSQVNICPIAQVMTDSSNNVVSIEDARPLFFALGRGGQVPDLSYVYPWDQGRTPNGTTESSTNPTTDVFSGGDKSIGSLKELIDAFLSQIKEIQGTPFWSSPAGGSGGGGSIIHLREDSVNTVVTGSGAVTHSESVAGLINWTSDIVLKVMGSKLTYKVLANPSTTDITLSDNQVAYINLVRDVPIAPNLIWTNGSPVVTSVGAASWTTLLLPGDYVRLASANDSFYYQILTVDSASQVTLTTNYAEPSSPSSGEASFYAYGSYQTVSNPQVRPTSDVLIADRASVPFTADMYWLFLRADNVPATGFPYTIAAAPTGAVRSDGVATFLTTVANSIVVGQYVAVASVTDVSFNGTYQVLSVPTTTTFTVNNAGPDATSGSGTVSTRAIVYDRNSGILVQGESTSIDGQFPAAVLAYMGSPGVDSSSPIYGNALHVDSPIFIDNGDSLTEAASKLDLSLDTPLRLYASIPTNNASIQINASEIRIPNESSKSVSPIALTTPAFVASSINFQTNTTTGGTFNLTFPSSTIGKFRRLAFSLSNTGTMNAIFSAEFSGPYTPSILPDAATLYVTGTLPVGWIDLECTGNAGGIGQFEGPSATVPNTIVNDDIVNVVGGGGGGSSGIENIDDFAGDGVTTSFTLSIAPGDITNTFVFVSGVYQQKDRYTLSGDVITFVTAPPPPAIGVTNNIEVSIGTLASGAYIATGNIIVNTFSGDGTTTTFTMTNTVGSINSSNVYITGVYQEKGTYSISGTSLIFSEAPPIGTNNIEVNLGTFIPIGTPSAGTVVRSSFGAGAFLPPTIQRLTAGSGTYTTPAGVLYLKVRMIGGGAGGASTATTGSGGGGGAGGYLEFIVSSPSATYPFGVGISGAVNTVGGDTTFSTNTSGGGQVGSAGLDGGVGGVGGTNTFALGTLVINTPGNGGNTGEGSNATGGALGGTGGAGPWGGAGIAGTGAGAVNSGSGGGGGNDGTSTAGIGGSGLIIVEEHYQ